jgi:putative flippase GtrA
MSGALFVEPAAAAPPTELPLVDVVIPVYNEQAELAANVRRLHTYVCSRVPYPVRITIADNASTDHSLTIARSLEQTLDGVRVVHLDRKGRGRALRAAWQSSDAEILAYMDVDLSTGLDGLLPLLAPLVSGHSDIAIGTRLARGSRTVRGPKREVISRTYNRILRMTLGVGFSDAQCGFKAIRADRVRSLVPLVRDEEWFFDTELLVLAERAGLRIHEVPVDWVDDPDSRVDIVATALADLRGIARLGRQLAAGRIPLGEISPCKPVTLAADEPVRLGRQLICFGAIGVVSTVLFAALYLAFRGVTGPQGANALALLSATYVNTAANRRLTFGLRGRGGAARHQAQGYVILAVSLILTSGALGVLQAVDPAAGRGIEIAVLTGANVAATLVKFLLFRAWVFRPSRRPSTSNEVS